MIDKYASHAQRNAEQRKLIRLEWLQLKARGHACWCRCDTCDQLAQLLAPNHTAFL